MRVFEVKDDVVGFDQHFAIVDQERESPTRVDGQVRRLPILTGEDLNVVLVLGYPLDGEVEADSL